MRGFRFSTDGRLPERDLYELADLLALQLHQRLGPRVFMLQRGDVCDLIADYVTDLDLEDQRTIAWMIWHLFQDALEIAAES